ncbi:MAG: hypothetical protein JKX92_12235 [Porticoccaceae bacterium]|nr:hypothetical protein [Porticoccaceae bacterium]
MTGALEKEYRDLLFGVRRSIRYNSRRELHYDRFHRLVVFFGLFFGTATIATFGAELTTDVALPIKLLPAVVISLLSAFDLIIGSAQKSRLHNDLVRDFVGLEKELELSENGPTQEIVKRVTAKRLDIEATEPPVLRVLDTICHNELMRAMGYKKTELVRVGRLQRFFSPIFDFREHTLITD